MTKRLRFAEWLSAVSALALFGFLFLDWFGPQLAPQTRGWTAYAPVSASGWHTLGWFALALCVLAIAAGLLLPLIVATAQSSVLPVFTGISTMLLGGLAVIGLIVQGIFQPGGNAHTVVLSGYWLGLIAAAGIARAGFLSIHDEHSPAEALTDVEVRPAPAA